MILGPACSIASELMGEVAQKYMNLTQVCLANSSFRSFALITTGGLHCFLFTVWEGQGTISKILSTGTNNRTNG